MMNDRRSLHLVFTLHHLASLSFSQPRPTRPFHQRRCSPCRGLTSQQEGNISLGAFMKRASSLRYLPFISLSLDDKVFDDRWCLFVSLSFIISCFYLCLHFLHLIFTFVFRFIALYSSSFFFLFVPNTKDIDSPIYIRHINVVNLSRLTREE